MNEHAGPACALSGLIVGIFAILLHDRNPPPPVPKSPVTEAPSAPRAEASKPEAPQATEEPRALATPSAPPPACGAVEFVPVPAAAGPGPGLSTGEARVKQPSGPSPPASHRPFAVVEPGESLDDVAARVYGSRDASEALWKANRDQVARVDSPLAGGTLLRTP